MFTYNKWDIEERLEALPAAEREAWMNGTYQKAGSKATERKLDSLSLYQEK